jgi:mono/diheme cytochrome c family protein
VKAAVIAVAAAMLAALAACSASKSPPPAAPAESPAARYAKDPAALERGKLLFVGSCGGYCHSIRDEERPAPSLFDCAWKHGGSDAEIHRSIAKGIPGSLMVGWETALPEGDDDVWKIVAYLRSASSCGKDAKAAH